MNPTNRWQDEDCQEELCDCDLSEDRIDWQTRREKGGDSRKVGETELALEDTDELPPVSVPIIQGCGTCNGTGLDPHYHPGLAKLCEDCHGTGIKTEYYAEPDDH